LEVKCRRKSVIVDVEPYRAGLEDGFGADGIPFINTRSGPVVVGRGNFIITNPDGEKYKINRSEFCGEYDIIPEYAVETLTALTPLLQLQATIEATQKAASKWLDEHDVSKNNG
jgi:hypothetical protein